ncbi:MAG: DUF2442 domain-containing protein [Armatimonadota bacterium]|nr:DUF2442 domain-containing protein [Armatimonadota bacterium]
MQKIIYVTALADYRIKIRFEDGLEGTVDLSDMVGKGVFASWTDPQNFAKVSIDPTTHTVAWPGGIDLCANSLHEEIVQQEKAA